MRVRFVIGVCVFLVTSAAAQTISFDHGYALVFPKDGIGFPVRSMQLYGDSIICLTPELRVYAKTDISKVLVRHTKPRGSGTGIGAILGIYSMHYALGRTENQPGAYLAYSGYGETQGSAFVWTTLLGIALGGGIGYLTDAAPNRSTLTPYVFGTDGEVVNEQWRLFFEETQATEAKPKFHFSLSGGGVATPTRDGYEKLLEAEGFTHFDDDYYWGELTSSSGTPFRRSTNFNWLRKAEIEYSITDNIRAGLATTWLSEPSLFGRKGQNTFNGTDEIYEFLQVLDGAGYYVTGSYHLYLTKKKDIDVTAKIGVGTATINHSIKASYQRNTNDSPTFDEAVHNGKYFSFLASAGANYYLFSNLSLGLSVNYFHGGSAVMDEIFIIDLPAMDVTYSTTDVGFTIGLHF